jgi:transcriptional regulator with XRE-family HTH domain
MSEIRLTSTIGEGLTQALIALRENAGISQAELAADMGMTQSKVSKLEATAGPRLRLCDVQRYLNALGFGIRFQLSAVPVTTGNGNYAMEGPSGK